jgi:hypothetical protein
MKQSKSGQINAGVQQLKKLTRAIVCMQISHWVRSILANGIFGKKANLG